MKTFLIVEVFVIVTYLNVRMTSKPCDCLHGHMARKPCDCVNGHMTNKPCDCVNGHMTNKPCDSLYLFALNTFVFSSHLSVLVRIFTRILTSSQTVRILVDWGRQTNTLRKTW